MPDQKIQPTISPADFIEQDRVKKCLDTLNTKFGPPGSGGLIVSDVLDNEGHQYVNLVQKGGGVLGVALVGYTYILEAMGIRFLRMAGTSAGAINTSLVCAIGKKSEAKSDKILKAICELDFFSLVDGHPTAKRIIKSFITHTDFKKSVKRIISVMFLILVGLVAGDIIFLGLHFKYPVLGIVTKIFFVFTGFYILLLSVLAIYTSTLFKRLKNSGFGINPGDVFYDWIKARLKENGVETVTDLNNKASEPIPGMHLRTANEFGMHQLKGDVTFITSELVTQNKIEFPKMCHLFRKDIDQLSPAGFVRASMSIPLFFESYFIDDIPCDDEEIKKNWMDTFDEDDPPSVARFVDGGILSNFPISIFYNPKVKNPRLPSFGIDLDDTKPEDEDKDAEGWSLMGYFGRMFNTIRNYYDKDFQVKNKMFKKGVGSIKVSEYNWLNFFLSDKDKMDMFCLGAEAATDFLLHFNWEEYKDQREQMQKKLVDVNTANSSN